MKKVVITLTLSLVLWNFSLGQCVDVVMHDLYTPLGSTVTSYITCEASAGTREARDKKYAQEYPNAIQIPTYDGYSTTHKFNCHGYAWIRVEQEIDRWVFVSQNDIGYIADNSYTQVSSETFPAKVYWDSPEDHSAITTEQPGWFISKWGNGPLCFHSWDDCPYEGTFKYYVKNCHPLIQNKTITTNKNIVTCGDLTIQNVIISNGAFVNIIAGESVTLQPNFHATAGTNVVISIGSSASNQPQNSMLLTNNEPKVEEPDLQSLLINDTDFAKQSLSFKLYPNPNPGTFQIETNFPLSAIGNLKITNLMGATVYETQNVASNMVQLQNPTAGTFFVVMILKDGAVLTQKMVIQK